MTKLAIGRPLETGALPVGNMRLAARLRTGAPLEAPPLLRPLAEPWAERAAARTDSWYLRTGKRLIDIAAVLISAPITVPVIAVSAVALWLESGLPFYRQDRMRETGETYRILKLRTMVRHADKVFAELLASDPALKREWDQTQKLKTDPRITRVGALLRSTSLDELPQLWNVLTGEMTLIGPRPVLPSQVEMYGRGRLYFGMKPGISGLWQVSARNDRDFAHRAEMDELYQKRASARTDFGIFLKTLGVMLRRTGY